MDKFVLGAFWKAIQKVFEGLFKPSCNFSNLAEKAEENRGEPKSYNRRIR